MDKSEKIKKINQTIEEYFAANPKEEIVQAKSLMPQFITKGIFTKDNRDGLPIRNLLRDLDSSNQLKLIPSLHVERKDTNRNWFFINLKNHTRPNTTPNSIQQKENSEKIKTSSLSRSESDECYVLDICDELLNKTGSRQHKFDFLSGDPNIQGISYKLQCDIYYPELNLVIEYREKQHTEEVKLFDRRMTVSGVTRGEQRKIYDQRRRDTLPENGIKLIEISYTDFEHDSSKRIRRNKEKDIQAIKNIFIKSGISTN